jgi:hypothetical protein
VEKASPTPASIKRKGDEKLDGSQHAHRGRIIMGMSKPKTPKNKKEPRGL